MFFRLQDDHGDELVVAVDETVRDLILALYITLTRVFSGRSLRDFLQSIIARILMLSRISSSA